MEQENRGSVPLNRSELYRLLTREIIGRDMAKVRYRMNERYRTDKFDRLTIEELTDFLNYLRVLE